MPTSKKSSKAASKKSGSSKKSAKKGSSSASALRSNVVPPYGEAIRQASARGDVQEMRKTAASARKWLKDVQGALDKLEASLQKSSK